MQRPSSLPGPRWLHVGAWLLATGAATTLSWFGVHTVLNETAEAPPRALPVSGGSADRVTPRASSTHRPRPSPSPTPSPSKTATRTPRHTGSPGSHPGAEEPSPDGHHTGNVRGATVRGGRAVFDLSGREGALVSATPDPGWEMRIWEAPGLVRVTFTNGAVSSSVFCRWDNGPPRIETYDG
ncbi:hypothetical protein [Streptomyces spirodelae]|uniref:Secreted protein n=1 Tax=Streptomyces spirodelae TaxID=2812904 RepID=A0ABS3WP23_9ACTN|nr:hypothetical protein [Streptomyces spirodelae]MBO8184874.1 hypothetical protein [Streptomyces spirodelae]